MLPKRYYSTRALIYLHWSAVYLQYFHNTDFCLPASHPVSSPHFCLTVLTCTAMPLVQVLLIRPQTPVTRHGWLKRPTQSCVTHLLPSRSSSICTSLFFLLFFFFTPHLPPTPTRQRAATWKAQGWQQAGTVQHLVEILQGCQFCWWFSGICVIPGPLTSFFTHESPAMAAIHRHSKRNECQGKKCKWTPSVLPIESRLILKSMRRNRKQWLFEKNQTISFLFAPFPKFLLIFKFSQSLETLNCVGFQHILSVCKCFFLQRAPPPLLPP